MRYTLKDIADFCYANKRRKGFRDWAIEQIQQNVIWARDNDKLYYVTDSRGICGVAIASVSTETKRIYIHHIVAVRSGFATLIFYAEQRFPNYTIVGLRTSKLVTFKSRHLWAIAHQVKTKALKKC